MTINAPASILLAFYLCAGEKKGARFDQMGGTIQNDILKEYIAQKSWIFPPEPSMRIITDIIAFCAESRPEMEHDQHQRLSYQGSGLDRRPGARVHARGRVRVRGGGDRGGARRRRLRAAALLLLQRAPRFLRGDREVPRGAAHLGETDEGEVRGEGSALVAVPFPYADGGMLADRAAAGEQHRPDRVPGALGRSRRNAIASYELDGRDARASLGEGGPHRAAHAADHRARNGSHQHDRSARRELLHRGEDARDGGAGGGRISGRSTSSGASSRRSRRDFSSGRSGVPRTNTRRRSNGRKRSSSA